MSEPVARSRVGPVDTQGCQRNHCHRPRSTRQEGSTNEDGVQYACHAPAGRGTEHLGFGACSLHGGNTPTGVVRADRERTDIILNKYATLADVDPAEALLEMVQRHAAIVRYLSVLISRIDEDDIVWGLSEEITEPAIVNTDNETLTFRVTEKRKAGTHPLIDLFHKESRLLREAARDAVNAGVAQRMVTIYETAGDAITEGFERVLESLDLTPEQRAKVPAAVVREMRMIRGEVESE
jgi:hypothetical protein